MFGFSPALPMRASNETDCCQSCMEQKQGPSNLGDPTFNPNEQQTQKGMQYIHGLLVLTLGSRSNGNCHVDGHRPKIRIIPEDVKQLAKQLWPGITSSRRHFGLGFGF